MSFPFFPQNLTFKHKSLILIIKIGSKGPPPVIGHTPNLNTVDMCYSQTYCKKCPTKYTEQRTSLHRHMTSDIYPSATVLPQNYMKFEIEIRFHLYYFY